MVLNERLFLDQDIYSISQFFSSCCPFFDATQSFHNLYVPSKMIFACHFIVFMKVPRGVFSTRKDTASSHGAILIRTTRSINLLPNELPGSCIWIPWRRTAESPAWDDGVVISAPADCDCQRTPVEPVAADDGDFRTVRCRVLRKRGARRPWSLILIEGPLAAGRWSRRHTDASRGQ